MRRSPREEDPTTAAEDAGGVGQWGFEEQADDAAGSGGRGRGAAGRGSLGRAARERRPRTTTPLVVWILAALGVIAAVVSIVAALSPETALSWVWPAGIGVFLGGAAWVLAALRGSPKWPGIMAAVLCVVGIAAPVSTATVARAGLEEQAQALVQDEDSEAAGDTFDESAQASELPGLVAGAVPVGTGLDVGQLRVVVQSITLDGDAAVASDDPSAGKADGRYVTATIEVGNHSDAAVSPGTDLTYELISGDGTRVDSLTCGASLPQNPVLAQDLPAGETGTYNVCFNVPVELNSDALLKSSAVRVADALASDTTAGFWSVG
ncbi:MAG: DUF4352 domain-containing protein [Arthrobacter sp.]|nr:DUF4352 domain-containing protein [Arthrobacter sp.]